MNNKRVPKFDFKKSGFLLAKCGLLVGVTLTIASYLGSFITYLLEITSHFPVQYLIVNAIALILLLVLAKKRTWIFLCLVCLTINGVTVLPWYLDTSNIVRNPSGKPLKILLANVFTKNQQHSKFISLVSQEKPDLVIVQEMDSRWAKELTAIHSRFPYRFIKPRSDNFGIGIYSSLPLENSEVKSVDNSDIPILVSQIKINKQPISIVSMHPPAPLSPRHLRLRNKQLAKTSDYVNRLQNPHLVIGDLNTTMWSPYYQQFIRDSGLKNTRSGFGIQPTWPVFFPILWIPIDHCLVSSHFQVISNRIGKDIGSDHYPVIAELELKDAGFSDEN